MSIISISFLWYDLYILSFFILFLVIKLQGRPGAPPLPGGPARRLQMPYSRLTCSLSRGRALLNFQGFLSPANFGPKFCFLSASNAGAPEGGTAAPSLNCLPHVVLDSTGPGGLPCEQTPCRPAPCLGPGPSSFRVGVEQGCKYL